MYADTGECLCNSDTSHTFTARENTMTGMWRQQQAHTHTRTRTRTRTHYRAIKASQQQEEGLRQEQQL